MKPRSRKHLIGQQVTATASVSRRLSIRVPTGLAHLTKLAIIESGMSRNAYVSSALERFRQKFVVARLALPFMDEELDGTTVSMTPRESINRSIAEVNNGLLIVLKETRLPKGDGVPWQILLNDVGLNAVSDILARVQSACGARGMPDEDDPTKGVKTVLSQVALWDIIASERSMEEVAELLNTARNSDVG